MNCRWNQRLTYAFVGLLSGDAALVLYTLVNAFLVRATHLATHVGEPERVVSVALQVVTLYVVCSLVGFLVVGIPVALLLPARFVARWPWLVTIAVGALLGPPALFAILVVLGGGSVHLSSSFRETGLLFAFSILVSTVSFGVYVALLRKQLRRTS
jgi:hypothetical protein